MPTLNTSNPQEPSWSYISDGYEIRGSIPCGCPNGDQDCITRCHAMAQAVLDAIVDAFPED